MVVMRSDLHRSDESEDAREDAHDSGKEEVDYDVELNHSEDVDDGGGESVDDLADFLG